ncbi:B-cell antigen receptor complex-associated protein alpha chain [Austrofundulus limnaeus]|uniref:B-cell antigen receptor complex-associated protein alpha chain n=1 Tax=Austrofundulus limnaeus TaxID=52670 RepID=A0A2I4BY83_AUSLI|nr:PREDICTED: B-cell antigen receptor complex-associated protein alpha chain [Austrofundulus limnaeus]
MISNAKNNNFLLFSFTGGCALEKVELEPDQPFLRVLLSDTAELKCCYKGNKQAFFWVKRMPNSSVYKVNISVSEHEVKYDHDVKHCSTLTFKNVQLNDTGLYQCQLGSSTFTHGTYLQVYKLMEKMINLSESTKNTILTAEGILLLLCVIVPSATILFKSKDLKELEMKKVEAEEENIYQGLNLDDCCTTYDQIERSQVQGQYQDVRSGVEEREEIQLEKP